MFIYHRHLSSSLGIVNALLAAIGSFFFSMATAVHAEIPENPDHPAPGLEMGTWMLESWANSGSADKVTNGDRKVLKLIYMGGDKDKTAFKQVTGTTADPDGKIRVHVYCPKETGPDVALAISTSLAYVWHETKPHPIKKGWNKIEVDLGKNTWKTEKTNWMYKTPVSNLEQIRAVDFLVFNGKETGWLMVEGLTLDLDEIGKRIALLIEDMTSTDPEKRAKAEEELVGIGKPALSALQHAKNSPRAEVVLRATWALRKIQDAEETLPEDPELKKKVLMQREQEFYEEAFQRSQYILESLRSERERLLKMIEEGREQLARGNLDLKKLEYTSAEDQKALEESLKGIDTITKELLQGFEDYIEQRKKAEEAAKQKLEKEKETKEP